MGATTSAVCFAWLIATLFLQANPLDFSIASLSWRSSLSYCSSVEFFFLFSRSGVKAINVDSMHRQYPPYTWCFVDSADVDRLSPTIHPNKQTFSDLCHLFKRRTLGKTPSPTIFIRHWLLVQLWKWIPRPHRRDETFFPGGGGIMESVVWIPVPTSIRHCFALVTFALAGTLRSLESLPLFLFLFPSHHQSHGYTGAGDRLRSMRISIVSLSEHGVAIDSFLLHAGQFTCFSLPMVQITMLIVVFWPRLPGSPVSQLQKIGTSSWLSPNALLT